MLILVLVVATLAVARLTRLFVEDKIMVGIRRWVVKKWGEESMPSYFIHCPWCMSIWFSAAIMPVAVLWPNKWVLMGCSVLAASYITGLLAEWTS